MTAPWSTAATTWLDGPLEHVVEARVVDEEGLTFATMSVESGSLTFDSQWSPYAQARLTAVDPFPATIDPRGAHRLILSLGYRTLAGVRDVHQVADLALTDVSVSRDRRTVDLTAQSDEALVQQSAYMGTVDLVQTFPDVRAAVFDLLQRALAPSSAVLASAYIPFTASTLTTNHTISPGSRWWPYLEALRDVGTADLWCGEDRRWWLMYSGSEAVDPSDPLTLATGDCTASGASFAGDVGAGVPAVARILTESSQDTSLGEWANAVMVEHRWDTGTQAGTATDTTGPYAVGTVGTRAVSVSRPTPIDAAGAAAEAAAVLRRTLRRGRVMSHTCAHSAYWLRPRRSIRTYLEGATAYEWVTRVVFDLDGSGRMTLSTRTPVED